VNHIFVVVGLATKSLV